MDISKFDYLLPKRLIAQKPANPRDSSRLLVIDRNSKTIAHHIFKDLPKLIDKNTVLVFNDTKVFPARIYGKKITGGKVEVLLLEITAKNTWKAIYRGRVSFGEVLEFGTIKGSITRKEGNLINIKFSCRENDLFSYMKTHGFTPLPPYIKPSLTENKVRKLYQTVYANTAGSAAAPTAGFHFTKSLLTTLRKMRVQMEYATLHVGLGTFAPIKERDIKKHKIHSEYFELTKETVERLNDAKRAGKRIIAVGTTTTRILESSIDKDGFLTPQKRHTNIYIYPPYKFRFVDSLITNFHLPKSTLLCLVSAFVSTPNTKDKFKDFKTSLIGKAYKEAIKKKYRFYSFGDASLIT
jgi:S-adenosylmethionine:tRNA ribosyltransferase-isomerase